MNRIRRASRATAVAGLVAVAALSAVHQPAQSSARPRQPGANSVMNNWAGEVASGSSFQSVTATWITPQLNCRQVAQSTAYIWVGLGGAGGSQALEQVGTMNWCASGTANYAIFAEFYSNPPIGDIADSKYPISAGDSITATVAETTTAGRYKLTLRNNTRQWTYSKSGTSPDYDYRTDPGNLTGETIIEPADGGNAQYSPVTFTGVAYRTEDGSTPVRRLYDTVADNGHTLATTARTSQGLRVTWKALS